MIQKNIVKTIVIFGIALLLLGKIGIASEDSLSEVMQLDENASKLIQQGKYQEAFPLAKRVLAICEKKFGMHFNTALALNHLAEIYKLSGEYIEALSLYERSLAIIEKTRGPNHLATATALNNLANLYMAMGDYAKALPLHERVLPIYESAGREEYSDTARLLDNIANVYSYMQDYEKALPLYERALALDEASLGKEHPDTASVLNNLGLLYVHTGAYDKALPLYKRSLGILEKNNGPNNPNTAMALGNIAELYQHIRDYSNALECYERSLAIYEKTLGQNNPATAWAYCNLGHFYQDMGEYAKAFPLYEKALKIDEKTLGLQHSETAVVLSRLALSHYLDGDTIAARSYANRSIAIKQLNLPAILTMDEKTRLAWQSSNLSFWPACVLEPTQLAQLALRWKGVVFASLMEDRALALQASGSGEGRQKLLEIQLLRARLAKLAFEPGNEKESQKILEQIGQLQRALSTRPSAVGRARMGAEMTLDAILSALTGGGGFVDLISFADPKIKGDGRNCYGAIIFGEDGSSTFVRLDAADEIDRAVSQLRAALDKGDATAVEAQTQFLSEKVWQPIAAKLPAGTKRLTICPDGKLNFLSFAALLNPDKSFAAEKYPISYVASGRDLARPTVKEIPKTMPIIANPLFDVKSTNSQPLQGLAMRSGSADLFGELVLPTLPGTAAEAESLKAVASSAGWDASIISGSDASEGKIRSLKKPGILHLATHGFFLNSASPLPSNGQRGMSVKGIETEQSDGNAKGVDPMMASGVALTGAQETLTAWSQHKAPDSQNDGVLTAEEVAGLNLDGTWLVTLSACETGVGESRSGEGVFGLRRAFAMAGAQNLLMTLWPVSDETTPKIMADFYKKALATGDAAGSLSEVQRDWLVKLRNEKGLLAAVRDAGPFAMVVMANPNVKQPLDENVIAQAPKSDQPITPAGASQDAFAECVQKTKAIMDQKIHQNDPSIQENCTAKFKDLLRRGLHVSSDEPVPFLDADFRYDTQDDYPKVNSTGPATQNGEKISVPVELQFGTNAPFIKTWVFAQENGTWLLDDVLTQKSGESAAKSMAADLSKLPNLTESASPSLQSSTASSAAGSSVGSPAVLEFADALAKADAGDPYSQGVVSIYYTMGYKVPKDTAKGLTYALKSAAQKNPLGIYQVGVLRVLGVGMKKDKAQGRKLISEAFDGLNAMNGDPYALYDLGLMALEGVGVDQNPKEAARLFKASADMGYAPAQRMFAKFLEAGVGVRKDLEAARQYQSQSSAQWSQQ
jgi:tetratricopeptide (TPR) repeat protein